ncbi:DegT/DnrJ/EryC1/StrS family aminotransferase [Streptomyces sp. 8N616]|uniref:DegT/DnrJ/EryC1/StrS family aminotransferase n=1 Tax=Streptomyces sp. 8N616 TaxID=3457414 RepID=UPI003FD4C349
MSRRSRCGAWWWSCRGSRDDSGQLDLADAARRITARTKAVVAVHLWGIPEDMDALAAFAQERGLMLLEDASHAHGAPWGGQRTGSFGTAAAFSLNGPKPLSAGEGGLVATDDSEIYYRVLLHGQYNKRCRREIPADHPLAEYAVTGMGLKLRIHPLAAALARTQLHRLGNYLTDGRRSLSACAQPCRTCRASACRGCRTGRFLPGTRCRCGTSRRARRAAYRAVPGRSARRGRHRR